MSTMHHKNFTYKNKVFICKNKQKVKNMGGGINFLFA